MTVTATRPIFNTNVDNFFIKCAAPSAYQESKARTSEAMTPPKKKVYNNLTKMLQEGYLVGSLKYGNNFIV